jgi:membrane dipeptidase
MLRLPLRFSTADSLPRGDPECRTETLFRHVDHYSELVGSEHVGLGLDVVHDADALNAYVRARPDEWPIVREPDWKGFRYAMPEQVRELTAVMLAHGFAIRTC